MSRMSALLACALVVVGCWSSPAAPAPRHLRPGDTAFWTGPHVDQSSGSWSYQIKVAPGGYRLRVGLDHPEVDDDYSLRLTGPEDGAWQTSAGGGLYSNEVLLHDPKPGTYRITVNAADVTDSNFRLRAKLEARRPFVGRKGKLVLPNLQVLPPHEASFLFPVTNGSTGDAPQGLDLAGLESCHPEEHAEDLAVRCLRFAFGVRNTGRGPLDMFFEGAGIGPDKPLFQRIYRAGGGHLDRDAGIARYHKTHGHYHHDAAVGLRLFSVTDRKNGVLEPAGEKRTKGFAHREELLREWDRFYPAWNLSGFGLGPGWADIYEWDRPGNYIDFGANGDGYYVIRMWADPVEGIRESNERDNVGYTYLEVTGSGVRMIESGRGRDPWDPCKIEVGFGGHPDPKPRPRPGHCAPDTT